MKNAHQNFPGAGGFVWPATHKPHIFNLWLNKAEKADAWTSKYYEFLLDK